MTFFLTYWRTILSALAGAFLAVIVSSLYYQHELKKAAEAQAIAVEAERTACNKSITDLRSEQDAYQKQTGSTNARARVLTQRVFSATCGSLSAQAGGHGGEGQPFGLDQQHMAELIELARKCDNNTAAALILNK